MRVKIVVLSLAIAGQIAACFAHDFKWENDPKYGDKDAAVQKGELCETDIIAKCQEFLSKNKLLKINYAMTIRRQDLELNLWNLVCKDYSFTVHATTGDVIRFSNWRRQLEQAKATTKPDRFIINNRYDALIAGNRIAERMSFGRQYEIREIREQKGKDGVITGYTYLYEQEPHGYRMYKGYGCYLLTIDPADGELIDYDSDAKNVEIVSWKVLLKESKAIEIADVIAKKNSLYAPPSQHSNKVAAPKNELFYVFYNNCFGSHAVRKRPRTYRLAWVIKYPYGDSVWIDAGTGKVLGGEYTTRKGHPRFGEGIDN